MGRGILAQICNCVAYLRVFVPRTADTYNQVKEKISMKPVNQTMFGKDDGNCFPACLASVLELSLYAVPHFCMAYSSEWFQQTNKWLAKWHLGLIQIDASTAPYILISCYHLMSGPSPRNGVQHSVVGQNGIMVHDPHPDRTGLLKCETFDLFVSLDAAQHTIFPTVMKSISFQRELLKCETHEQINKLCATLRTTS